MPSLAMNVVKSKLGTREITLEFAAESSDRMDRLAETARLVGGFTFTGTARHFVQYRDAGAPFGYDATELLSTDAALALYHDRFSQTYDVERRIELRPLLLRLMPHVDPSTKARAGAAPRRRRAGSRSRARALPRPVAGRRRGGRGRVADRRARSTTRPCAAGSSAFPSCPTGCVPSMHATPGITCFVPAGSGVAVEAGYRHPVELRACPVFDAAGLVLVRGRGDEPWVLERVPPMGALTAFARVEMRTTGAEASVSSGTGAAGGRARAAAHRRRRRAPGRT